MNKLFSVFDAVPRRMIAEIVLAALCVDLITLSVPIFSQIIFDKVVVHNSHSTLIVIGAGMVVATFFESLLGYLYARHVHLLTAIVDDSLTHPVISKLVTLPLSFFEGRSKGEIAADIREIQSIRESLSAATISAVVDLVFMVFVLILIASYSVLLAIVVATCIPILSVTSMVMRPIVRARYKALSDCQGILESIITEGLHNIATLKALAMEGGYARQWVNAHEAYVNAGLRARQAGAAEDAVIRLLHRAVLLAVLCIGATEVLANQLSLGQLLASYLFAFRVLIPSTRIFQVVMGFSRIHEGKARIDQLLAEQSEYQGEKNDSFDGGDIHFRGVSFGYGDRTRILHKVELTLPATGFIGIVGPSGSGKSTLSRLLQRHILPQEGQILLGGVDIRSYALTDLRKRIALVTHDSALFKASIKENICAGDAAASDEDIWRACELAGAANFLAELPGGLDTVLDERGAQLSAGQRQRIALARTLLTRPRVLVLDEATNALDVDTESTVLAHLRREFADRTLIVVTHRVHVLKDVDLLIQVGDGITVHQGIPSHLLSSGEQKK